jgi:hypothetical protein
MEKKKMNLNKFYYYYNKMFKLINKFKYLNTDNHSYKVLCKEANKLYNQNIKLQNIIIKLQNNNKKLQDKNIKENKELK